MSGNGFPLASVNLSLIARHWPQYSQCYRYWEYDCTYTLPDTPKTSETCNVTHALHHKMSFRRTLYSMSQFKRFSFLNTTEKSAKEIQSSTLLFYFTQVKPQSFFKGHTLFPLFFFTPFLSSLHFENFHPLSKKHISF